MKNKFLAMTCMVLASAFAFGACGGGGETSSTPDTSSTSESSSGNKKTIAQPLDLGADFNSAYYPAADKIEKKQGVIDVVLVFEDSYSGWEALAAEYSRLHGGAVAVKLNNTYTDANTYQQNLMNQVTNSDSEWDIVQGNLFTSGLTTNCINMNTYVWGTNAYAGEEDGEVRTWGDVLTEDAYITGILQRTVLLSKRGNR